VNDQYQSRREYFAEHGHWPSKGRRTTPAERYTVTFTPAPATPPAPRDSVPATPVALRTPEQEAWREAYSGQGHGPISCRWVQSGAKLRCQWLLGTNSGSHRPPPRN
jgi:hypothetical protein